MWNEWKIPTTPNRVATYLNIVYIMGNVANLDLMANPESVAMDLDISILGTMLLISTKWQILICSYYGHYCGYEQMQIGHVAN